MMARLSTYRTSAIEFPVWHADGIANARRQVTHIDIPVVARHPIENGTYASGEAAQIVREIEGSEPGMMPLRSERDEIANRRYDGKRSDATSLTDI
jgi:hypothetical protein